MTVIRLLPVILVAWSMAVAGGESERGQTERIGMILPADPSAAIAFRRGAELAVDPIHSGRSRPPILIVRESSGQWGTDGNEAARLVLDDEVRLLIAPPDGIATHLILQIAGRTRTPVISLSGDRSITAAGIPWALRLGPSTTAEATLLARLSPRWAVVVPGGRAGRANAMDLGAGITHSQAVCVLTIEDGPGSSDAEILRRVVESGATGVMLWLEPARARRWLEVYRASGCSLVLAGPYGWRTSEFTDNLVGKENVEVHIVVPVGDPIVEAWRRSWRDEFSRRYGRDAGELSLRAAEAVQLAVDLLQEADTRPVRSLFPWSETRNAAGPWRFNASGDQRVELQIQRWNGRTWEIVRMTDRKGPMER